MTNDMLAQDDDSVRRECGYSSKVEQKISNLLMSVRVRLSAPILIGRGDYVTVSPRGDLLVLYSDEIVEFEMVKSKGKQDMSHDRGCPCGREKYEYRDCNRGENCYKWDYPDRQKPAVDKTMTKGKECRMIKLTDNRTGKPMLVRFEDIRGFFEEDGYTRVKFFDSTAMTVKETIAEIHVMILAL